MSNLKEVKKSYQSGVTIIRNHRKQIVPIPNDWIPYGICIDVDKNTFYAIVEKGRKNILFIVVQGEFYICDDKELVGYWLNYKEVSSNHNLDRKKDFINVTTKQESAGKGTTLGRSTMAGRCFIRYDVVKKLGAYDDTKILQFEAKLKKLKVIG